MKIGFEVFLTVCEEMSITRAARRLFITQQAVSDHIRRLEEKYKISLFQRKPDFHLTAEGEIMRSSLQQMKIMERNMERTLSFYSKGSMGNFTVGISTSRAPIILPQILPEFSREFPLVCVSFDEEDTQILEERLRQGNIDLFIGVNTTPDDNLEIHTIAYDEIMLVVPESLLQQYFSSEQVNAMKGTADLRDFIKIPFVLPNFMTGKVSHVIQEYLASHHVQLNVQYNISDSETQIDICSAGKCAAICPRMLLGYVDQNNRLAGKNVQLRVFSLKDIWEKLSIDLVIHKRVVYPPYVVRFMELVKEKIGTPMH